VEEKYSIDANLAKLLYEAARSNDVALQVQAIAILKGNYLPEYLKNFGCKKQELNSEFYYNVIKLVSIYLKEIDYFLVIVFDEYEHVFSWKSKKYRKNLYEDIKLFTDNLATFGNMFFVFAESDSVDNESESSDDPAFKSRKANLTYQIADISSETEVEKLFRMILKRYEKYYEVSFEAYTDDILQMIYDDPLIREKTNYRGYTQAIMRVLDQFRNKPPKAKRVRRNKVSDNENGKIDEGELYNIEKEKYDKWKKATSISKKTMLCEMLEKMIATSKESIVSKSKKKGEYLTRKNQCLKRYYIISTDNPSKKDFEKRVVNLQDFIFSEEEKIYVLYPTSEEDIDDNSNIKTILYNDSTVENSFKIMYGDEIEECDIDVYLSTLDIRRSNAKD
ncbi:BREX system ATP-binding domain-containing protein, partial [Peptostreptococcus russellii]|uniref:BREX system ATP-binding domain-containing protein n=1 Tax=Peptostreptococcus russellii TaxID=215200 RepID=UPI0029433E79